MKSDEVYGFSPTILLVDDELAVLKVLSRELLAEDYSVTAVSSGGEAISALQDTYYDLVITDVTMEGIDGLDVVKAGVDDFLVKPFEIEELLSSIQLCVNKRSLQQI